MLDCRLSEIPFTECRIAGPKGDHSKCPRWVQGYETNGEGDIYELQCSCRCHTLVRLHVRPKKYNWGGYVVKNLSGHPKIEVAKKERQMNPVLKYKVRWWFDAWKEFVVLGVIIYALLMALGILTMDLWEKESEIMERYGYFLAQQEYTVK